MTRNRNDRPLWVDALLDKSLSAVECRVLMYLCWRQGKNHSTYPSQEVIGSDLGLTRDGVRKITRRLESRGWLHVTRPAHTAPGRHLEYRVSLPPNTQTAVGVNHADGCRGESENHADSEAKITQTAVRKNTTRNTTTKSAHRASPPGLGGCKAKPKARSTHRSTRQTTFIPPTAEEVAAYADTRGDPQFDAAYFVDWYEQRQWKHKDGKPVLDWKGTMRDWIKRDNQRRIERGEPPHDGFSQYGTHPATDEEIEALEKAGVL